MAITTQLIGSLGSKGYYFPCSSPTTFQLPPNPNGWSILFVRWDLSGYVSYRATNRKTGEELISSSTETYAKTWISASEHWLEAARDGINLEIMNSTNLRICIASGVSETPPTG